ncbi:MAG TPA: nucleoside triphosphate pyrophosphatase [Steroidobacteraceae bacterium]
MPASKPVLCLASASPRRRALLAQIGVAHVVRAADIDEAPLAQETPRDYVARVAAAKACAIRRADAGLPVLAADTIVVIDGTMFGKPDDRAHGLAMLASLSGRSHEVLSAVALADARGVAIAVSASAVRFRTLSADECQAYWDSGEPHDKAGAYAIQGLAAAFIESLHGSYSGVMGLPLFETAALLRAAGVPYGHKVAP